MGYQKSLKSTIFLSQKYAMSQKNVSVLDYF